MSSGCPVSQPNEDWDPLAAKNHADPTDVYTRLRDECPVAWSDRFGGFYALTRFKDVTESALDWHTFTSAQKTPIPDATSPDRPPRAPAEVDPPFHTAYRDLLNRFFTPEYIRRIEPVIRRTARDLIGRCVSLGEVDAVASFTFYMPIQVQCIFLGISVEDADRIKTTINRIIDAGAAGDTETHKAANDDIYDYIYQVLATRKKAPHDPNDLISAMIYEEVDGRRLTDDDIAGTIRLFLQAGHGTTTNMLGSIIRHVAENSEDQKRLRNEPKLIPQAIEEMLRVWTPVRLVGRKTTRDVEIEGRTIPQGSRVGLMVSAANLDERKFDHADKVDFDRKPNPHIAFGFGPHRCVGASLAREQLRIAAEELLSMTDDFELTGEPEASTWTHLGPSKLPVRFVPRSVDLTGSVIRAGYRELVMNIAAVRDVAEATREIELRANEDAELPEWTAGAHIDLVLPGEIIRSYSLVDGPSDRTCWRIAVLREENGRGGSAMIHTLKAGDQVRVRWPRNKFALEDAEGYHFFASGIGITPILPMIEEAQQRGVPWRLDYVGRTRDRLAYLDRLEGHEQVRVHPTSEHGRPELDMLVAASDERSAIYACGSQGFLLGVEEAAERAGRNLHAEWFAPKPGARQAAAGSHEAFTVHLQRSDVDVSVQPGQSIIDACAEAGVTIPAACFEGTCSSCLSTVLEGVPDHRDSFLSPKERESGMLMAPCVSKSMTERLVLDW
ncbi:cytochrome P450 [Saccharopolyspora mangrovi]|uniref:Cytochrome P450 n=1 Tax=Saccharopolyspora mangrovi TaxID=3082379 RepID=A0ABU6AK00_9PSEU|nr:cytochrome P450 [Saccharopolyspora sp. S2-29]MEB3371877.1 cytochrome P450 [Saccharopolyspora sp. S2-29]